MLLFSISSFSYSDFKVQMRRGQIGSKLSSSRPQSRILGQPLFFGCLQGFCVPLFWPIGDSTPPSLEQANPTQNTTKRHTGRLQVPSSLSLSPCVQSESQCLLRSSLRKQNDGVIEEFSHKYNGNETREIGLETDTLDSENNGLRLRIQRLRWNDAARVWCCTLLPT